MKMAVSRISWPDVTIDALIVPLFEGDKGSYLPYSGPKFLSGLASRKVDHTSYSAISHFDLGLEGKHVRLVFVGLGLKSKIDTARFKNAVMAGIRSSLALNPDSLGLFLPLGFDKAQKIAFASQAILEATYNSNLHQSNVKKPSIQQTVIFVERKVSPGDEDAAKRGSILGESVNFVRDLVNHPANIATPSFIVKKAEEMARKHKLVVKIYSEKQITQLGMEAFAAVASGSEEDAYLIALSYKNPKAKKTLALVGKGVTFDSGGISIKPAEAMDWMKMDMAGGAAVLGAMLALSQLQPAINVLGLIPVTENLPSGKAVKPGDVVKSLSGKTIEIANTDAEGRLILADVLTFAIQKKADYLIDVATLTGSTVATFGDFIAGLWARPEDYAQKIIKSGQSAGERYWSMPLLDEYAEMIKSYVADLSNIGSGGRKAGAITAAKFLENFAGDLPWAHLDIAGTAWVEQDMPYRVKGATGFGVATLVEVAFALGGQNKRDK